MQVETSVRNAYRDSLYRASWLSACLRYYTHPFGNHTFHYREMPSDYREWRESDACFVYAISGGDEPQNQGPDSL
jgi:hypothetical protein